VFNDKINIRYNSIAYFYKFIFDRISIELANDDINQLNSLLLVCIESPNEDYLTPMMENLVTKLSSVKNSCVDKVLGLYYLKYKRVMVFINLLLLVEKYCKLLPYFRTM